MSHHHQQLTRPQQPQPPARARAGGRLLRVILLLGCWHVSPAAAEDINLGVIAGITGLGASYGLGITQGAEMAVRDINAAGGIHGRRLKLVIVDDATSPPHSAIAMRRLVTTDIAAIVGGWGSPQVLANMDIVEQTGIPYLVVGATNPRITSSANRWTFRVIPSDAIMADQLVDTVVRKLGIKRIAIINDTNAYGSGNRDIFIASLARAGIKPVEVQAFQSGDQDFGQQLTRIAQAKPEALAVFATVPAAPAIMNQARALGIKARFLGTGGLANQTLITQAPAAVENAVLLASFFAEEADAQISAWTRRYQQQYGGTGAPADPTLASWEYRAIRYIVAPCLERVGVDRVKLRDCIAQWRGKLFGIDTETYFDHTGQLIYTPVVLEIRDGRFRLLR
jgi:branched-chain amino acid transport system substrate-binding protein